MPKLADKPSKRFYVEFTFPELSSGIMYQNIRVDASGLGMAVHKGFQEIKKRPQVKGRRLHNMKVHVADITSSSSAE